MTKLVDFIQRLPQLDRAQSAGVYPASVNRLGSSWIFVIRQDMIDRLVVVGDYAMQFHGEGMPEVDFKALVCPLDHHNAVMLRALFPFTAPIPVLHHPATFGVGDRLGIATPGHIQVFQEVDAIPVLAQQSIRELTLTGRTYEDVLDVVTYAVYREGFKKGYGADGDHLKKPEEIEMALRLGFSMITLDCSDHIDNSIDHLSDAEVDRRVDLELSLTQQYLNRVFCVEGNEFSYDEITLKRIVLIYGKAIDFACGIYQTYFQKGNARADFEISIDETFTSTTPLQHYFVASELIQKGVKIATLAPRFCGEFQKGIDYIGDLDQFEAELKVHAAIARHFGYKLSIHSGSDKFSVFPIIGKYTQGHFHVKTAGTNWLEAMRAVSVVDPSLYREIHAYALDVFQEAKKYYHVTTDLTRIPALETLSDAELPLLFSLNEARQLIHITYGLILNAKTSDGKDRFRTTLYQLWQTHADVYAKMLYQHIGKHLTLLYSEITE